jgi:hypothetical protein
LPDAVRFRKATIKLLLRDAYALGATDSRRAKDRALKALANSQRNQPLNCASAHLPKSACLQLAKTCGRA